MTVKTMNNIDALYDAGMKKLRNGLLVCPVCEKTYKCESSAKKHIEARDCHSMKDLVKGTVHEVKGYAMYQLLVSNLNPEARVSLQLFQKSPMYNPVMKFTMFCSLHAVFDCNVYLSWLNEIKKFVHVNQILKEGIREDNLREFRIFAQKYDLIPSAKIYDAYREDLLTDDEYLVRCIEKAQIGLNFLAKQEDFPFEERLASLPVDYQNRITDIAEAILA